MILSVDKLINHLSIATAVVLNGDTLLYPSLNENEDEFLCLSNDDGTCYEFCKSMNPSITAINNVATLTDSDGNDHTIELLAQYQL